MTQSLPVGRAKGGDWAQRLRQLLDRALMPFARAHAALMWVLGRISVPALAVWTVVDPIVDIFRFTRVASCNGSTIHTISQLGTVKTLSLDAKQRLVVQGRRQSPDNKITTCAEPSPDALVAQAAVLAAGGSVPSGGSAVSGNAAVGFQESAGSLAHRTQTIQILRDGYYRLCEAYLNGAIGEREYIATLSNIDVTIAVIAAIDGLGNAPSTPAIAIGTGSVSVNGGTAEAGASAAIGGAPQGQFSQAGAAGGSATTSQNAAAIQAIVLQYITYVERRNRRYGL